MANIDKAPFIRASSLAKIMTDPRSKSDKDAGLMSETAKGYCYQLAKEAFFGVEFTLDNKYLEKGRQCENDAIKLLSFVTKKKLEKHTGRESLNGLTGECDILCVSDRHGYDTKVAWSLATFPAFESEVDAKGYEWQARAYMALYDCDSWSIAYCMVETPEELIGYEPRVLHCGFGLIDESKLVTICTYKRDLELEAKMFERIAVAREFAAELIEELEQK